MNKITSNKLPAPTQNWIWNFQSTYCGMYPIAYVQFNIKDGKKWKKWQQFLTGFSEDWKS